MLQSKVNYDKFYGHRKNRRTFKFRSMLRNNQVSGVIWGKAPRVAYLLGMDATSLCYLVVYIDGSHAVYRISPNSRGFQMYS